MPRTAAGFVATTLITFPIRMCGEQDLADGLKKRWTLGACPGRSSAGRRGRHGAPVLRKMGLPAGRARGGHQPADGAG